ncbi:SusC/RagA family TonB-linked outer membrane protein [Flavobacterium alvei]|uniref:SusC/RagA family TonB-linked outer membrane protein n=1 Tax=Flavobacterium alvei TaxID=2080416 RepID=A0A2S5ACS6_9FLAO|nr:SusC/RagA family TonB-linked outer membrane protein [Flavobacterium alvei]POY40364.1 SusC/RagA family TonB-linked outer membrane protein [Flavobacterium alvei]
MKTIYKKLLFLLLFLPFCVLAQNTIGGTVLDKITGQPIPGVNVNVQGSTTGASTDLDGKFRLSNVKKGDKVVFSFVGYKSETIVFSSQQSISVQLEEDSSQLKEVVIQVGYGTVKKKDATGAVAVLGAKDFNKGVTVNADNLFNGRVAGVTVNAGGGAPGSGSTIRIRGGASLNASNDPLIVIDGLPIENSTGTGSTSFLASLNPSTIESFSILKDASATAIYGSRASNGVILITTKKGGKNLSVEFNSMLGIGNLIKTVDVFDAATLRKVVTEQNPSLLSRLGNANTDWQKEIYRQTTYTDANVSVRGSLLGVLPTRLTVGKTYQEGLRLTNVFNRNTVGLALNPTLFQDHLKLRLNANYSNENNSFADAVESSAINFDPTQPVYDNTSKFANFYENYNHATGALTPQTTRNPVAQLLQTDNTGYSNRLFGNFEADYKMHFLPELRAVVNVGFDETHGQTSRYAGLDVASSGSNNNIPYGTNEISRGHRKNTLFDAFLAYNKTFDKLVFDLTGGYSYQKFENNTYIQGNLNDPNLPTTGVGGFPQYKVATPVVLLGYFARTNLNYNDKYLLTLSYRRDGSSRFAKENRFGNFPAASFAWKASNDFFKDSETVSDLKVRVGWGITGQQDIGDAANIYLQKYVTGSGSSQYTFGTTALPIAISSAYNEQIKWEETTTYNAGVDYGLFKNRINGSVDVFYKVSSDLLVKGPLADGSNFSNAIFQNVGQFTTKGVEFTINADIIKSDNFNWNVNFNATHFDRKIDELIYHTIIRTGDNIAGTGTQAKVYQEGFAPDSFWVYKQLYDVSGKPIEGAYADSNGDGVINADDKYIYKNQDAKLVLGFTTNLNYNKFDLSFALRSNIGNSVFNAVNASRAQYGRLNTGADITNLPTSVVNTGFNNTSTVVLSDIYVENASFLRMDNISLGYTFPKWFNDKISLRLTAGCQNVFVITKYSGLDPEINNGVDGAIYPRQRSFLFGTNIKF